MKSLRTSRIWALLLTLVGEAVFAIPVPDGPELAPTAARAQYGTTVQLAIQEPNQQLLQRNQGLIIQEFEKNVQNVPQLRIARMSIQKSGNEVVFSMLANEDLRIPMRQVLVRMIESLNGRVGARGRTSFYRTSFAEPEEAQFTVKVHDPIKNTVYINAKHAVLIDLLQAIRRKVPSFSYIIPQECALRKVFWSFGNPVSALHPQDLELNAAMSGIAEMLQVKMDSSKGAYVFSGDCRGPANSDMSADGRGRDGEWGWPTNIIPMRWPGAPRTPERRDSLDAPEGIPVAAVIAPRRAPPLLQSDLPVQVYFPVTPIDYPQ